MRRRMFCALTACSTAALSAGLGLPQKAYAGVGADQAAMLKTTLTPTGAERAGNAAGTIPAWTGGNLTVPAGWTPSQPMPDMFADDKPILTIDASNMAQYEDQLSVGIQYMMKNQGFKMNVFPTRRTAAAPQWVYDNVYQNALNAKSAAGGARLGFVNAYGGVPFPIPDQSDPLEAGAQVIWNHQCRWQGEQCTYYQSAYSMINNSLSLLTAATLNSTYPYYQKDGSASTYDGFIFRLFQKDYAPPESKGLQQIVEGPTDPTDQPMLAWQLLAGQGRVRKAPELEFDVPQAESDGLTNYDEVYSFQGSLVRYDWKLVGKKEMFIPYNNNGIIFTKLSDFQQHFLNPDIVRWELHRVWVVDATLHPGERHVVPHRRVYADEDTWIIGLHDQWDAQDNIWKVDTLYVDSRPDLPGTVYEQHNIVYNFQQNGYVFFGQDPAGPPASKIYDYTYVPPAGVFNPTQLAASASY